MVERRKKSKTKQYRKRQLSKQASNQRAGREVGWQTAHIQMTVATETAA